MLFLVGGDDPREEELRPTSGIRQGDPHSPILFSLATSLIIYVLSPHNAAVWLSFDDVSCALPALTTSALRACFCLCERPLLSWDNIPA